MTPARGKTNKGHAVHHISSPPLAVKRLSLYLRYLESLQGSGQATISSRQVAEALGVSDAQVRRDLAECGRLGRPRVGYEIAALVHQLRTLFGTEALANVLLVGVGRLGRALLGFGGFRRKGFNLVAAFDIAPRKIGQPCEGIFVQPLSDLPAVVRQLEIAMAIVTVPAPAAQEVADLLCQAGIRGILNFAPVRLAVPPEVWVVPIDLAVQLEQLSYLVRNGQ